MKMKIVQVSSRIPHIITSDTSSNLDGVIIYSHEFQPNFMIGVSHHDSEKILIQPPPPMDFDKVTL